MKKEMDMCTRPLFGKIILFSLPLMFTGILQLLYNAADIIIVGRFASDASAGAVGSTGSLVNLIINLFIGLSVGACATASRYIGAKQMEKLDRVVHTSVCISFLCGIVIGIIGFFFSEYLLVLMNVPKDSLLPLSTLYLKIFFLGTPFNFLYNFCASLLRAKGNNKTPLLILASTGIVNVVLNFIFVYFLHMDVAGVAAATVISQAISAACILVYMMRIDGLCKVTMKRIGIYKDALKDILYIGLPAGIQGCIFSLSNVIIQSSINIFGDYAVTGNAEAANIEGFVYTSMNAVYQACLTFTGQNYGAGKKKNIDVTLFNCLIIVSVIGIVMGVGFYLLGEPLLRLYTDSPEVIAYGIQRMKYICVPYFLCGIMEIFVGSLRGLGKSLTPMIVSIVGVCGIRIIYIFTVFATHQTLPTLYLSYIISWIITAAIHGICLFFIRRKVFSEMDKKDIAIA